MLRQLIGIFWGILRGVRAWTVQTYVEANVKNGLQFYLRRAFRGAPEVGVSGGEFSGVGEKRYIYFQTGSKTVIVKDRVVKYIGEEFMLTLYKNPEEPTALGQQLSVANYRLDSVAKATTISANEVLTDDVNGLGEMIGDPEYYFGSNSQGHRNADNILEGRERILPPNSSFYIEIEMTEGTSGRFEFFLDWYEGKTDLPRKQITG